MPYGCGRNGEILMGGLVLPMDFTTQADVDSSSSFRIRAIVRDPESGTLACWKLSGKNRRPSDKAISFVSAIEERALILMRKIVQLIFAVLCAAPYSGAQAIPSSYFGMHVNRSSSYPLKVPYGNFRGW